MKNKIRSILAILCALSTPAAFGATANSSLQSKLVVTAACTVTVQDLDFGTTGLLSANIDAVGGMNVICTNNTYFMIQMDKGLYGTSTADRKMKAATGTDLLNYKITYDFNRTLTWGNGPSDTPTAFGNGGNYPITFFGRVPVQSNVKPGTYTDTVAVTIVY